MTLTYNGNRINTIADVAPSAHKARGFKADIGTALTYGYDVKGNLTNDPHKGLAVGYNYLNLPDKFDFGDGDEIEILYDAEGMKLRKTVTGSEVLSPATEIRKDYCMGIEYEDNELTSVYNDEGRAVLKGGNWEFQYVIRDHLGNTRVMFKEGTNGLDVLQQKSYYPFGGSHDLSNTPVPTTAHDYLYNSKELQREYGLDWMDFGMRHYMTWIPQFSGIDPIAENFSHISTFNYAENEPVGHIDLWGLQKYKPKMQSLDGPKDLFSSKMANNLKEGIKTALREYFSKEVGTAYKDAGGTLEYVGFGMSMAVNPKGPFVAGAGAVLDKTGTVILIIDGIIESKIENEIVVEVVFHLGDEVIDSVVPKPFEDVVDIPDIVKQVFEGHVNSIRKAVTDGIKQEVNELVKEESDEQTTDSQTNNCEEECEQQ